MTNDQIEACDDLWREALAAGLVRWMPGMFTLRSRFIAKTDPLCVYTDAGVLRVSPADMRLDWSHPATTGCLLAMAREATGDAKLHCYPCGVDLVWRAVWFLTASDCRTAEGETEPEALLRAILATRSER